MLEEYEFGKSFSIIYNNVYFWDSITLITNLIFDTSLRLLQRT